MGVAEILPHTHDITRGSSVDRLPPAPLCAAVLDRLFPDAPSGGPVQDVVTALLGRCPVTRGEPVAEFAACVQHRSSGSGTGDEAAGGEDGEVLGDGAGGDAEDAGQ